MEHEFTKEIKNILRKDFGELTDKIFSESLIIQYLNIKTKSASKGSKTRGSFANLYAIYVLVEDYILKGFHKTGEYRKYEGAVFTKLFKRQRELPFGQKLQNHALNHRMNQEFKKFFPTCDYIPILRDLKTNRYWFNENLLKIKVDAKECKLAESIIQIIDTYIETKKNAFEKFIRFCESAQKLSEEETVDFIGSLVEPTVDARIFEIVSFGILKYYYHNQNIYWGFELDKIQEENLKLYKTGRTNANDGGIDFVMKPLGRFFQVTETVDVNKYFLDIDKIENFDSVEAIRYSSFLNAVTQTHNINENIALQSEEIKNIKLTNKSYDKGILFHRDNLLYFISQVIVKDKSGDLKFLFEGVCSGFIWHLKDISQYEIKRIKDKYGHLLEEYFIFLLKKIFKDKNVITTNKDEGKPDAFLQFDDYIIIFEFTTEPYRFSSLYNTEKKGFLDDLYRILFNEGKGDTRGRNKKDEGKFFKLNTYIEEQKNKGKKIIPVLITENYIGDYDLINEFCEFDEPSGFIDQKISNKNLDNLKEYKPLIINLDDLERFWAVSDSNKAEQEFIQYIEAWEKEEKNIFHYNFSLYMNNKSGNVVKNSRFKEFFDFCTNEAVTI
ncbi:MAG: hypothetical protein ACE5GU_07835 [Candidatus Scalinduaceae bacterium]